MSEIIATNLSENSLVGETEVLPQSLVPFPKEILARLGVSDGSRLTLVCHGDQVTVMNSAIYAMKKLQSAMEGEAQRMGLNSVEEADAFIKEIRSGE